MAQRAALLACYAERFSTVDVDSSFRRLPDAEPLRRWRRDAQAPRDALRQLRRLQSTME